MKATVSFVKDNAITTRTFYTIKEAEEAAIDFSLKYKVKIELKTKAFSCIYKKGELINKTTFKDELVSKYQDIIDNYNLYTIEAEVEENGHIFQWRKYKNFSAMKKLGGIYANWCDNGNIKFYKSAYLRDRAYTKFVNENSEVK